MSAGLVNLRTMRVNLWARSRRVDTIRSMCALTIGGKHLMHYSLGVNAEEYYA
jgi:hypothetical protein